MDTHLLGRIVESDGSLGTMLLLDQPVFEKDESYDSSRQTFIHFPLLLHLIAHRGLCLGLVLDSFFSPLLLSSPPFASFLCYCEWSHPSCAVSSSFHYPPDLGCGPVPFPLPTGHFPPVSPFSSQLTLSVSVVTVIPQRELFYPSNLGPQEFRQMIIKICVMCIQCWKWLFLPGFCNPYTLTYLTG